MKNITPENISQVEEYKKYINDLSKVQDKLFTNLENLLESDDATFTMVMNLHLKNIWPFMDQNNNETQNDF